MLLGGFPLLLHVWSTYGSINHTSAVPQCSPGDIETCLQSCPNEVSSASYPGCRYIKGAPESGNQDTKGQTLDCAPVCMLPGVVVLVCYGTGF